MKPIIVPLSTANLGLGSNIKKIDNYKDMLRPIKLKRFIYR